MYSGMRKWDRYERESEEGVRYSAKETKGKTEECRGMKTEGEERKRRKRERKRKSK